LLYIGINLKGQIFAMEVPAQRIAWLSATPVSDPEFFRQEALWRWHVTLGVWHDRPNEYAAALLDWITGGYKAV
jgi:hypothetical protein